MKSLRIGLVFNVVACVIFLACAKSALAVWQEPTCDPAADPGADTCNISAPLNVSTAGQTKEGSITVQTGFTMGSENDGESSSIDTLSGRVTLTLPESIVTDSMVNDNITSQKFTRSSGLTDAVDLGTWSATYNDTAEVLGYLDAAAVGVTDVWVNTTGDTMSGTLTINLDSASTSKGIDISSASTDGSAYPINVKVTSTNGPDVAIYAETFAGSGSPIAIYGNATTSNLNSIGVKGRGTKYGVAGFNTDPNYGIGVYGESISDNVSDPGVYGYGNSENGTGVWGSGGEYGVVGTAGGGTDEKADSAGVVGTNSTNPPYVTIVGYPGVYGESQVSGGYGILGRGYGVGVYGIGATGIIGETTGIYRKGVSGSSAYKGGTGVYGEAITTDTASNVYGVYGYALDSNTKSYGGYFSGNTGVYGTSSTGVGVWGKGTTAGLYATGEIGLLAQPRDENGDDIAYGVYSEVNETVGIGIYAAGRGFDDGSGVVGGYGVKAKSIGDSFAGVYGEVVANSLGNINGYGVWGYAPVNNSKSGIYGKSDSAISTSYGVEALSTGAIGLYSSGKTYAAKFDGQVIAGRVLEGKKYTVLDTAPQSGGALGISKTLTGNKSIVFDGSELWTLTNDSNNALVSRFNPQDIQLIHDYSFSSVGITSNLVSVGVGGAQGVLFWSSTGTATKYNWTSKQTGTAFSSTVTTNELLSKYVSTGLYTGKYIVGTTTGEIYTTSNLLDYTNTTISAGGSILKFILDDTNLYVLVDVTPNTTSGDKIIKLDINDLSSGIKLTYSLPFDLSSSKQQSAKNMVFDGRYMWVTMQNTGSSGTNGSLAKIDVNDPVATREISITDGKPTSLVFDGSYLWVATSKLKRFTPHNGDSKTFFTDGTIIGDIEFDGTYLWFVTDGEKLKRIFSGQGNGSYGQPWAYRGINMMDDNGSIYCVKVNNGGGSLSVPSETGSCSNIKTY